MSNLTVKPGWLVQAMTTDDGDIWRFRSPNGHVIDQPRTGLEIEWPKEAIATSATHTKGPWEINHDVFSNIIILSCKYHREICTIRCIDPSDLDRVEEIQATARLIVQSPAYADVAADFLREWENTGIATVTAMSYPGFHKTMLRLKDIQDAAVETA